MKYWLVWIVMSIGLASVLGVKLLSDDQRLYLPGQTSNGHYQIEMACAACHGDGFTGQNGMQKACVSCHGAELKVVDDSHPKSKFTDPRNADRVEILDARYCVTCHSEHQPERMRAMGVTMADDFCMLCHKDVAKDRPSHKGMAFDSCASAGCHNYHDNSALYEDFLVKHAVDENNKYSATLPLRNYSALSKLHNLKIGEPLAIAQLDAPPMKKSDQAIIEQWAASAHARGGVNCSDCHQSQGENEWLEQPGLAQCQSCHKDESKGFMEGKHGMRLAQSLGSLQPSMARQPMKRDAYDLSVTCNSCHGGHDYNTKTAAVDSCLSCHDDQHSRHYKASPHYKLLQRELAGELPAGSGVSCASCHMPRGVINKYSQTAITVDHNQNNTLRPNEKMIRSVCMNCHGLALSIDALADEGLVSNNFTSAPTVHVKSIELATQRVMKRD